MKRASPSESSNLFWPIIYQHQSGGVSYAVVRAKCLREALNRADEIAGRGVTHFETMGLGESSQQDARDLWPVLRAGLEAKP